MPAPTFLGGSAFFFGPIIGAIVVTLMRRRCARLTKAWLLYLGLVFLFMVMYAPGGIASLIMMNLRLWACDAHATRGAVYARWRCLRRWRCGVAVLLIEMIYNASRRIGARPFDVLGVTLDTTRDRSVARRARAASSPPAPRGVSHGRLRVAPSLGRDRQPTLARGRAAT